MSWSVALPSRRKRIFTWVKENRQLILFEFLGEFESGLASSFWARSNYIGESLSGNHQSNAISIAWVGRVASSIEGLPIWRWLLFRFAVVVGAVPLAWASDGLIRVAGRAVKVEEEPSSRRLLARLQLLVVHAIHFISRVECTESILVRHSTVGRVRHRVLLMNLMPFRWIQRCLFWCSLHELVSILVGVSKFVIDVNFSVAEGLCQVGGVF